MHLFHVNKLNTILSNFDYFSGQVRGTGGVIQADNPSATGVTRMTTAGRMCDGLADKLWDRFGESYYNEIDFMADVAQG